MHYRQALCQLSYIFSSQALSFPESVYLFFYVTKFFVVVVYIHMPVHVCSGICAHVCMCVQRSEVDNRCRPYRLVTLIFEAGSLKLELTNWPHW